MIPITFYNNPVYVRLCERAEDIQALRPYDPYLFYHKRYAVGEYGIFVDEFGNFWSTDKWVPRPDQLMDVISTDFTIIIDPQHAQTAHISSSRSEHMQGNNWYIVLLGYIMKYQYNKEYNEDKWEQLVDVFTIIPHFQDNNIEFNSIRNVVKYVEPRALECDIIRNGKYYASWDIKEGLIHRCNHDWKYKENKDAEFGVVFTVSRTCSKCGIREVADNAAGRWGTPYAEVKEKG